MILSKSIRLFLLFLGISVFAFSQNAVPVSDLSYYHKRVQQKNDTLYVVNFWATWCKPCVQELPFFQQAAQEFSGKPVKIILVSMDMKTQQQQVGTFLSKNRYTSETFILSAGNPNVWIDKIEPKWSGAIPITLFYRKGKKIGFMESDFPDYSALQKMINSKLK